MEDLKTGLAIVGGIALILIVIVLIYRAIMLSKYDSNNFYENH